MSHAPRRHYINSPFEVNCWLYPVHISDASRPINSITEKHINWFVLTAVVAVKGPAFTKTLTGADHLWIQQWISPRINTNANIQGHTCRLSADLQKPKEVRRPKILFASRFCNPETWYINMQCWVINEAIGNHGFVSNWTAARLLLFLLLLLILAAQEATFWQLATVSIRLSCICVGPCDERRTGTAAPAPALYIRSVKSWYYKGAYLLLHFFSTKSKLHQKHLCGHRYTLSKDIKEKPGL